MFEIMFCHQHKGCSGHLLPFFVLSHQRAFLQNVACLTVCVRLFTESIYRRGARRWRKLYYASGHAFQAKRFNRVRY